ncbi:MAG: 1-acyl-sn-glycerol-3-phosphate acyltransferase [Bacteroidetes bacterium]|nr:1-acyl-sn-glycerol-3-phosphate acyltransferase [Bacteroidota bacterium]
MENFRSVFTWVFTVVFLGLMFPVTCIIWFAGYPFDRYGKLVHRFLLFQGRTLTRATPLWKFKIEGTEKIRKGQAYVIICNHQSVLDIILLNNIRTDFRWISKAENFRVPILGQSMRMAGYISIQRGNKDSSIQMHEKALKVLSRNTSIMMFPEGTRSQSRKLLPFKLGAFHLALNSDKPILPVVIDGTGAVLPKHGYRFRSGHILRVSILDPVFPGAFGTGDAAGLAEKFSNLISEELEKLRTSS